METKANIAKAIIGVMKAVKGIEKNTTVGTGNSAYKGVSDKDVKNAVGKAMEDNGLCILPISIETDLRIERWEESYGGVTKPKQSVFTAVKTKYLLLHESGESIEIVGAGHGVDSQDKGVTKSTTYALKYALLYAFMIPTGTIDDADKHPSEEIEIPKAKPVQQAKTILTQQSPNFDSIKLKLANLDITMQDVERHYTLSEEIKTALTN